MSEHETAPQPALMSVAEAARFLGVSRATAYRYANKGLIPVKRYENSVYVLRAQLIASLTADTKPTEEAA
ncbi:helix-turn-helix domain-containing protein [Actinosynnema pretiosum subsp. pretiosum]|uniref:Helix-turn-helix domain-containing protein n=1 Tax=Actinosynnema pretiosum subsp. pretiosum TaxID=103721 RepID=A0AA45R5V6_9PSEU|nr:hypothetical protein APASM_2026 [Actinosynnema pretiosum subsp. pretiosum]QUF06362.1 helix-turn-helix domain-containing protein [Actinosynnema pretiosum subsp. pretiosum]